MFEKITYKIVDIIRKKTCKTVDNCLVKNEFIRSPKSDCFASLNSHLLKQVEKRVIPEDVSQQVKSDCFKFFFAKNPQVESVIKKADFESFGQCGLPLKYSRNSFISDFNKIIKKIDDSQKNELIEKLTIEAKFDKSGKFLSYEGIPTLKNLDSKDPLHKEISTVINKFTRDNEVITDNPELNKSINSLIKAFPEFINVIGKKQHDTHAYSVDIHTMKVLKEALNHPEYEKLSDKGKTVMKMSILFHDFSKQEGIIDQGHPKISAFCTKKLLQKIKMPNEMKDRIFELVKNHHWLVEFNKKLATPQNIAARFRNPEDYQIAKIFAASDLKGVNNVYYKKYGNALSQKIQAPIEKALKNIINSGNLIITTRIVNPSKIQDVVHSGKTYKVINFTKIADDCDLDKFGFVRGTKKKDVRFLAHFLNGEHNIKKINDLAFVENDGALSASFLSLKNNDTFYGAKHGFTLNTENRNIVGALNYDFRSGFKKTFESFSNLLNKNGDYRTYLKSNLISKIKNKFNYKLNDDEYGQLYKQLMSKKHIGQVKDINIGGKTIKGDDLRPIILKTQDTLFNESNSVWDWNEVVVYNPKISSVICKEDSIKKLPKDLLDFAHKKNLPIVLLGK